MMQSADADQIGDAQQALGRVASEWGLSLDAILHSRLPREGVQERDAAILEAFATAMADREGSGGVLGGGEVGGGIPRDPLRMGPGVDRGLTADGTDPFVNISDPDYAGLMVESHRFYNEGVYLLDNISERGHQESDSDHEFGDVFSESDEFSDGCDFDW